METTTGSTEDFMKLIGMKWTILSELYDGDRSPKEISDKLVKKLPWISTQLKLLKDNGLIDLRGGDDGRKKIYFLLENTRRICGSIINAQIETEEPGTLQPEPLELILQAVKDDELAEDLRKEAISALIRLCSPESKSKAGVEVLREFFLEVIDDLEAYVDKPKPRVLTALEYYVDKLDRIGKFWFNEECYPRLLSQFEKDKRVEVRTNSINILSRIYNQYMGFLIRVNATRARGEYPRAVEEYTSVTNELSKLFMEALFNPGEDEKIAYKSWEILSSAKGTGQKELLTKLYEGVKASDEKIKKRCAKLLKEFLASYEAPDTKGKHYEVGKEASVIP